MSGHPESVQSQLYFEDVSVICGKRIRKNLPALLLIQCRIPASGRIVSNHKFPCPGIQCAPCSLDSGGMIPEFCLVSKFLKISGFMIKQVHTLHPLVQFRKRSRIAAICITSRLIRKIGRLLVAYQQWLICPGPFHEAIEEGHALVNAGRTQYILTSFQCSYLGLGKTVLFQRFLADIQLRCLLPEHITVSLDLVVQRKCQNLKGFGGINHLRLLDGNGMEVNVNADALAIIGEEEFQKRTKIRRTVNDDRCGSRRESQCGKKREETENMVAVDMGDEDGVKFGKGHPALYHLPLDGFTAVYQKQAPMYFKYVSALKSIVNGHCRSSAHYLQSKIIHP